MYPGFQNDICTTGASSLPHSFVEGVVGRRQRQLFAELTERGLATSDLLKLLEEHHARLSADLSIGIPWTHTAKSQTSEDLPLTEVRPSSTGKVCLPRWRVPSDYVKTIVFWASRRAFCRTRLRTKAPPFKRALSMGTAVFIMKKIRKIRLWLTTPRRPFNGRTYAR